MTANVPNWVAVTAATVSGPIARAIVKNTRPQSSRRSAQAQAVSRCLLGRAIPPVSSAAGAAMTRETEREIAACDSQLMSWAKL